MTGSLCSSSVFAFSSQTGAIEALGWALVHFVWQGAAVAFALAGFLGFTRRLSPQVRYGAACVALSLMTLAAGSTFGWYLATAERPAGLEPAKVASPESSRPTPVRHDLVRGNVLPENVVFVREVEAVSPPNNGEAKNGRPTRTVPDSKSLRIDLRESSSRLLEGWTVRLSARLTWLVACWGIGVGLLSLRLAFGWRAIRRLRASANDLLDPIWVERFSRLRERLSVAAPVRLLSSTSATVPLVVGSLKPAILMPASLLTGLSTQQVEALLIHELVHIRRHDYFVNLLQNVLETLFFYHPAVWWVSGQIRKEREHCCDDVASAACGAFDYAQALTSLAELRLASRGLGLAANSTPLVDRIRRLAGVDPSRPRTAGWLAILSLVALITAAALRPANHSQADGLGTKTVKGTVIDAHGRPVAEAEVIAESHHARCGTAQTNGQGEFQMPVPAKAAIDGYSVSVPHWFEVSFALDKQAPLALSIHRFVASATVEKQEPLVLKIKSPYPWGGYLPPSGTKNSPQTRASRNSVRTITGNVVDHEGQPIANAHVWWLLFDHGVRRPTVLADGACDPAGRFRMEIPSESPAPATPLNGQLWALAPGKQPKAVGETEKLRVAEGTSGSSEIIIHLDPAPDFSFQVNDAGGRPVGGATLERLWCGQYFPGALLGEFVADPEWPAPFRDRDRVTTDASGVAHLSADSDEMRITAREYGIQTFHLPHFQPLVFPIGGKERYVVKRRSISLRPVGRVEGQVFAGDMRLVRGRKLRISTFWEADNTAAVDAGALNLVEGSGTVTTNAQGRFSVPAIAEGTLRFKFLDAQGDASLIPIAQPANVRANETTSLQIRLRAPALADGHVQADATGEPVAGAEIFLGGGFELGTKVTADEHGRFRAPFAVRQGSLSPIRLPDERHADYQQHYSGVLPGKTKQSIMHSPSLYKVFVRGANGPMPLDVPAIVRIPSKMLEGTVVDDNGRPVAGAWVEAKNGLGRYVATADAQGAFEFQVPKGTKFESVDVSLSPRHVVTDVKIRKQDPLVLQVSFNEDSPPKKAKPARGEPISAAASKSNEAKEQAPSSSKPARRINGQVIDYEGKPIANAHLWWVVLDDFAIQRKFTVEGVTDAKGRFQLQTPSDWKPRPQQQRAADTLWILAPGKDLTIADAADGLIGTPKSSNLIIQVKGATETTYQVKDPQGRPVIGALVEARHFHTLGHRFAFLPDGVREALAGTTDASGRVRLHWLPRPELFDICVTASGFGTQTLRLDGDDLTAAERTVKLRAVSRIEGRLSADDSGATRGVKLAIETKVYPEKTAPSRLRSNTYSWIRETEGVSIVTTDQSGRFVVPAIAGGMATVAVLENPAKPAFLLRLPEHLTLTDGQTHYLDLPMERSVLVRGAIRIQDTQEAVGGAHIRVSYGVRGQSDEPISDAQGRYAANVLPGQVTASVNALPETFRATYEQTERRWTQTIPRAERAREFELPPILLAPFEVVKGTLIDQRGRVVAGAGVTGTRGDRRYRTMTTNADGQFDFHVPKNLRPNAYEVDVPSHVAPPYSAKVVKREPLVLSIDTSLPLDHSPEQAGDKPRIASPRSGDRDPGTTSSQSVRRIAGRVVDPDGKPAVAAQLWWVVLESVPDCGKFTVEGRTNEHGRFELQAPSDWKAHPPSQRVADSLWILAPGKDLKVVTATDALIEDRKPAVFTVQLDSARGTHSYQVNDPEGRPIAGAVLDAPQFRRGAGTRSFPVGVRDRLRTTTDKAGRARFDSIPRNFFTTVLVTAPGFGTQRFSPSVTDAAAAGRTLTLRPVGRIEGRLDAEDHNAVRGLRILFQTETEPPQPHGQEIVTTDETGRFLVPAIAEGPVRINFLDSLSKSRFLPRVPGRLTLEAGTTLNADMRMVRPLLVKGSINTADTHQPVVGAKISVGFGGFRDVVVSDAQGRYEAHVLPGWVRTQVIDSPQIIEARYTEIGDARSVEVREWAKPFELPPITLAPTESIAGTLIDRIGRRVSNASVCGIGQRRRYGFTFTNSEGEFVLRLPKKIGVDSFEVWLSNQADSVASVKIMKYRPLVLAVDSPLSPESSLMR